MVIAFSLTEGQPWLRLPTGYQGPGMGLKPRGWGEGETARACRAQGSSFHGAQDCLHSGSGAEGGASLWEPWASLLSTGVRASGETEAAQHTPTPRKSPPHPPRAAECPYCPSPDLQGKWTALSQGGEVRPGWGVGLWRPGPGTQQRKFQAAFRATGPRDMQHTRSSSCGLRHPASQLLASGCLALQPAPTPAH